MTRAIFLRRFQTVSCARCCGACSGTSRTKQYAVGFVPSVSVLIEKNTAPVASDQSLYAVVA